MKVQKFLVQVQFGPETRWMLGPEHFARIIQQNVERAGLLATEGEVPAVTVTQEEKPEGGK